MLIVTNIFQPLRCWNDVEWGFLDVCIVDESIDGVDVTEALGVTFKNNIFLAEFVGNESLELSLLSWIVDCVASIIMQHIMQR